MSNQIKLKRGSGSNPGTSDLVVGEVALRTDTGQLFTKKDDGNIEEIGAQAGVSDGDKGDITVSNSGATFTIDNNAVSTAKMADMPTDRILGREASGTGDPQYLTATEARSVLNVEDGATADQTASEILTLLKTVDGSGSGLVAERVTLTNQAGDSSCSVLFAQSATGDQLPHTNANLTFDATSGTLTASGLTATGTTTSSYLTLSAVNPNISFTDTNNDSDFKLEVNSGEFKIIDSTNSADRLTVASDGTTTIAQDLIVNGDLTISGTTTTIDTSTLTVEDKNIELGKVSTPSDTTADGGGITLKGATDKTFNWINSTDSWTSSEHIALPDSKKLQLGSSQDLQIYHDGTHSYITNSADVNTFYIQTYGQNAIKCIAQQSVELYENGTKVAETTAGGFNVEGVTYSNGLDMDDNHKILLGTGDDLEIYHNGTNAQIDNSTGNLEIRNKGTFSSARNVLIRAKVDESSITCISDGAVELYHDDSKKLETTSGGVLIANGNISSVPAGNGTASGVSLDTTGGDIFTGRVFIQGDNKSADSDFLTGINNNGSQLVFYDYSNAEHLLKFNKNGSTELNHNGSKKFETSSGGVSVTGNVDCDGIRMGDNDEIRLGDGDDLKIYHSGSHSFIKDSGTGNLQIWTNQLSLLNSGGTESMIQAVENAQIELYYDNNRKLETTSYGALVTGTMSAGSGNFDVADNGKFKAGNSSDLQIYHDGSNSYIDDNGTGNLEIRTVNGTKVTLQGGTDAMLNAIKDGAVQLYHAGALKAETRSDGFEIKQHLTMGDSDEIRLGDSSDLKIYHNGSGSYIDDSSGTGELILKSDSISFTNASENEYLARFFQDNAVELYFNGNKKFATTNNGISVTGRADLTGNLIIDSDSPQIRLDEADTTTSTRLLMSGAQFYLQTAASGQGTSTSAGVINLTGYNNTNASLINLKANTINLSGDLSVPANEDIRFATGTWSGNQTKIQHHANALYIVGGTSGIWFRDPDGTNRWKISDAGHLEPLANDAYDIGSSSNRIRDLYTGDLNLSNEGSGNDVDGTWGSYTIQEGEESLFLINKRNGKKYKFNLTEVS